MKADIELRVRLKVADLVAQTAQMALAEKMGFEEDLRGIVRYSYWSMTAEGGSLEEIVEALDREIRLDSAFTNQNKHHYLLRVEGDGRKAFRGGLDLDKDYPGAAEGVFACDVLVTEQDGRRNEGFAERLAPRLEGIDISNMRSGEVWRLLVRAGSGEEAARKVERMAVTRTRREGLLLNPHYQAYEILQSRAMGGG